MTITLTSPKSQPALTVRRLIRFAADVSARRIITDYELGYIDGSSAFVGVKTERRMFTDETTPSFTNFIAACPAAGSLRRQAELYEATLSDSGTVD